MMFMFSELSFLIYNFGYLGVFVLMTIESSFIPFPSEIILIPAGYLAFKGDLNIFLIIAFAVIGSVIGALINYYIGYYLGKKYLLKHKKIFFIKEKHLLKSENFFKKHGNLATFIGRLIPVVRQYISIPAGFSNMKLSKFIFWTFSGALIWSTFLTLLGYLLGGTLSNSIIHIYNWIVFGILGVVICYFIIRFGFSKKFKFFKK